jgi:hypothetical protein
VYRSQPKVAPASIDTRRISRFETSGKMSSRYSTGCASKRSVHGIDTTSAPMPSASSRSATPSAISTSDPVAIRITLRGPPAALSR